MTADHTDQFTVPFVSRFVATGFFSGYSPVVPGTAGSLVGLAIYALPGIEHNIILSSAIIGMFFWGVYVSHQMEKKFGEDPQIVVIDEIVGMWISLLLLPKNFLLALLAFVFFRIYDIIKPPPARNMEHLRNGWGIMLDDVVAGIYANITMRIFLLIYPAIISTPH